MKLVYRLNFWNATVQFLLLIGISILVSCASTRASPARLLGPESPSSQVVAIEQENLSLKDKANKYRAMVLAGTIGLKAVIQEERDDQVAYTRKIALWVSLASILGFVAGCVLLGVGSATFGMIALVGSGALFVGCVAYASVIVWAGPILAAVLGSGILVALGWEAWKHRKALFTAHGVCKRRPPAAVQRLIKRVQVRAGATISGVKPSFPGE